MQLSVKQVAEIFYVSETRVIDWINAENLPAELVADRYRFHRADLLEWAAIQNYAFSPSIYAIDNGDLTQAGTHLAETLEAGGVLHDVAGADLPSVLRSALAGLTIPESLGRDNLIALFMASENLRSTAIGRGIAVPHSRMPLLLAVPNPVIRLCYLNSPLPIAAPDGKPVDTLFLMICPTVHEHLQLLARLGALMNVEEVRNALQDRLSGEKLFNIVRDAGRQFHAVAT